MRNPHLRRGVAFRVIWLDSSVHLHHSSLLVVVHQSPLMMIAAEVFTVSFTFSRATSRPVANQGSVNGAGRGGAAHVDDMWRLQGEQESARKHQQSVLFAPTHGSESFEGYCGTSGLPTLVIILSCRRPRWTLPSPSISSSYVSL